jgi:hypothetical protein
MPPSERPGEAGWETRSLKRMADRPETAPLPNVR